MNSANTFWTWFLSAHHRLESLRDGPDEALLDETQRHLQTYSRGLWFEIGGHPDGPLELVISAEGKTGYFADVLELVGQAPEISGWQFVAFKPAHGFDFKTKYDGVTVDPGTSWFLPLESASNPTALGLRVAVPGFTEEYRQTFQGAVFVALEAGLGELVAAESIQHIEVVAPPNRPADEGYIGLNELDKYLQWRASRAA